MAVTNPAGFWKRFAASLLDGIVVGGPITLAGYLATGTAEANWFTSLVNVLYALVVPVVWHGYTVGKRIVGIRIVRLNGAPVGIGTMFLRSVVGGLVYFVTLGAGLIVSAILVAAREDKRSLHDLIAGTYVTTDPPAVQAAGPVGISS
ncbi:RDD family protein [Thermaerobacter subterraneus]|uniref:Membrane protein n=1 Tax=Thermaerobacter subterraneus DSM 13965 TaxID=867903 RepID=K6QEJ5_9FIRM|nr:RDD family protein [Thermaerobacter subterraneus]EKP95281.1 putative membrane protein [Thermaerobacter subterraneus DSM 13965]